MGIWDDEPSSPSTRVRDDHSDLFEPDLEPRSLQVQQHRDSGQIAELAQVAAGLQPRDMTRLERQAKAIGAALGRQLNAQGSSVAFYSFPMGGSVVEGPSVALMNALAGAFGRLIAQVHVLDYDHGTGRAMLRARVVDLESLRAEEVDHPCSVPPAPAKFARKPDQVQRWITMQLRAQGSRAKRNALEQVIPAHVVAVAMLAAKGAYAANLLGSSSVEQVRAKAIRVLAEGEGPARRDDDRPRWQGDGRLSPAVLAAWLGVALDNWTIDEIGALSVLRDDLAHGRRTVVAVLQEAMERGDPGEAAVDPTPARPASAAEDLGVRTDPTTAERLARPVDPPAAPQQQPDPAPADPEEDEKRAIRSEIDTLKAALIAEGDGDAWVRVKEVSGVDRLLATSSLDRYIAQRDAAREELAKLRGQVDDPAGSRADWNRGDDEDEPANPVGLGLGEAFLRNVHQLEQLIGPDAVAEATLAAFDGKTHTVKAEDLGPADLRSYAQELYAAWEDAQ